VYNTNKLAKLVKDKKKNRNWLDYYMLKYERKPEMKPTCKV
jgi:calcium permeable stress-gated cation channel